MVYSTFRPYVRHSTHLTTPSPSYSSVHFLKYDVVSQNSQFLKYLVFSDLTITPICSHFNCYNELTTWCLLIINWIKQITRNIRLNVVSKNSQLLKYLVLSNLTIPFPSRNFGVFNIAINHLLLDISTYTCLSTSNTWSYNSLRYNFMNFQFSYIKKVYKAKIARICSKTGDIMIAAMYLIKSATDFYEFST